MVLIGWLLLIIGYIGLLVTGIWLLVLAFQDSVIWGLACLCLPFVSLIFVITHWEEAKAPFLGSLSSAVPWVLGSLLVN